MSNVRLRYQFDEGTDLYLVYDDRVNTDRGRLVPQGPELPFSQRRTLLVKYSRRFTLQLGREAPRSPAPSITARSSPHDPVAA